MTSGRGPNEQGFGMETFNKSFEPPCDDKSVPDALWKQVLDEEILHVRSFLTGHWKVIDKEILSRLKCECGGQEELAELLGYANRTVVSQWLKRGIPQEP